MNMAGPASFCTVETMMVLDCLGKGAVESRGDVMSERSITGRMGMKAPADASSESATPKTVNEASRTSSVDNLLRHELSSLLHESCVMRKLFIV